MVSERNSSALSAVWDGSSLEVFVLGSSLVADAVNDPVFLCGWLSWSFVPDSEWSWTQVAGVDGLVVGELSVSDRCASADDQSVVSERNSSALSAVCDSSSLKVFVLGSSLIADAVNDPVFLSGRCLSSKSS